LRRAGEAQVGRGDSDIGGAVSKPHQGNVG
jgi:hypothetical protein